MASDGRREEVISNILFQWENSFLLVSRQDGDFLQVPSLHTLTTGYKSSSEI